MIRFKNMMIICGVVIALLGPVIGVGAQGDPDAWPTYNLNMRAGPGTDYAQVTKLAPNTGLMLEARTADSAWVLGHTLDNGYRGWLSALYLGFRDGFYTGGLPVSREIVAAPAAAPDDANNAASAANASYAFSGVGGIDLNSYPIVAAPTSRAYSIYAAGVARGNNPHVVAKVGDCGTDHPWFLYPFYHGNYSLGGYGYLQGAISQFGESFTYSSQAACAGFVASAVIDPQWANPGFCNPGESALQCEYRLHKPSVALIMFGLTDLQRRTPEQFYSDLRVVVDQTADAGVIPILSTFPRHLALPEQSILFNQIVIKVALDTNVPLMNFWRALEPLPSHGVAADGTHMTGYASGGAGFLTEQNLQHGFTMRNLVTLQSLDAIWRGVMGGG
ncbi:MAG: SGNH/GDSL hydrolase family protein [Anaerolineae bacterium]|nr:SGNH/GDSL hydrolase family protein [Anaerolineae bacterium]